MQHIFSIKKHLIYFVLFLFIITIIDNSKIVTPLVKATKFVPYYEPIERFGITIPYPSGVESLIESINVRAILDWRIENTNLILPDHIEYIHVIRVGDEVYNNGELITKLPTIISNNLGDVWIIGNEPDRFCYQDSVNPETYAERYFEISTLIRTLDPTAKLGFGSIVQPTPIRIRYLQRALDRLIELSGNEKIIAMGLIDIWSIHAFILNEHPFDWGAGVPVGFYTYTYGDVEAERIPENCFTGEIYNNDWSDSKKITDFSDTYSIDIFKQRIKTFREWLNYIGERDKPLWITEYGSLFPPIDPPPPPIIDYVNFSDEISANFLIDSFNFLLYTSDAQTGFAQDSNKLVQRWFWYSLNDYRYNFGGTLFDPDNNFEITTVGIAYKRFTDSLLWENKLHLPLVFK